MSSFTSRLALPYPVGTQAADVPTDMAALATALDIAVIYGQGVLASRPAFGIQGRLYMATDTSPQTLYYDTGSSWVGVNGTLAHVTTHAPGGTDPIPWTSANGVGVLASRPAAAAGNAGYRYFATDQVVEYISTGSAWVRVGAPAGMTTDWFDPNATAPTGWVKYDGTNLAASTGIYADLYAHLGSTLVTPDTRGRTTVSKGTHTDVDTIGKNDGVSTVGYRRPKHGTSKTDPGHQHPHYPTNSVALNTGGFGGPAMGNISNDSGWSTGTATTGITVGSNNANDVQDAPAFIVALKIAKL